jgi:hypothetical protein
VRRDFVFGGPQLVPPAGVSRFSRGRVLARFRPLAYPEKVRQEVFSRRKQWRYWHSVSPASSRCANPAGSMKIPLGYLPPFIVRRDAENISLEAQLTAHLLHCVVSAS